MEGAELGIFMISAGLLATILEFPKSPVHQALPDPWIRRVIMGIGIGLTAVGLIYSPWGQRSGAHMNPAVTLTFLRLGKVHPWDAFFYIVAQTIGGTLGVIALLPLLRGAFADPPVRYIATVPGPAGTAAALAGEFVISLVLMFVILVTSNHARLSRFVGLFAGVLLAIYITVEAPLSGMSINPARSFASALPARVWTAFWIYLIGPTVAMLVAAELYRLVRGRQKVYCAKLNHHNRRRCIFACRFGELLED
jgi:aquaporin Z